MCFTTIKQLKLTELFSNKSSSPDPAQKDYRDILWQLSSVRLHCDIQPVPKFMENDQKPAKKVIYQTRSNNTHKLVLQWDCVTLNKGILHRLNVHNEIKYHQLVLPQKYH